MFMVKKRARVIRFQHKMGVAYLTKQSRTGKMRICWPYNFLKNTQDSRLNTMQIDFNGNDDDDNEANPGVLG